MLLSSDYAGRVAQPSESESLVFEVSQSSRENRTDCRIFAQESDTNTTAYTVGLGCANIICRSLKLTPQLFLQGLIIFESPGATGAGGDSGQTRLSGDRWTGKTKSTGIIFMSSNF